METEQASRIARVNDAFRNMGFEVTISAGVQAMPGLSGLLEAVREYDEFFDSGDPYGEHDFGTVIWDKQKVFWKIDYYDQDLRYWCDPVSPECRRVLTVMLAREY